ncbi:Polyketide synthase-nonribosomal peptide synthetase [Cytospora mali]|uniref:Polyketide synthase-nonribosomal peptide synthetase n=1 Tax=Cytospora mali TaxID=578113 RepID=A0A194W9S9_CYTMA|nr:Polyketide synthase-nonribosomal peptide synthetase [Valsa mali]
MAPHSTHSIDDAVSVSSGPSTPYESEQLSTPQSGLQLCAGPAAQDIAIIGMACKLPGGVDSPSKLWDILSEERSGQCDLPKSRFNIDGFYHPTTDRPGSMHMKGGYFLQEADVRNFENGFFGINNMEAQYMDPQQRKLLESVYEAFESAGLRLDDVSGSNIGCYVGNFTMDFQQMQLRDSEYLHRYSATGLGTTILGNRVSHVFNLQGPSFVIDTACSSSLYCLHAACVALENNECDGAVVAGANLIQSPEQHFATMKAGVLSPTSTCHTFDASADGYGRADGIGALYLKRLDDAIRDGDPIRSVIRGSAINANGRTPGITLPDKFGQEKVIRKAHAKAGLPIDQTPYIECHGTGTPVGDPIEAHAVSLALNGPQRQQPILVGSVKSNLGHSEAASGISSVIKATLILEKGLIPATIGVRKLNPKIKAKEWNVDVVTQLRPFPSSDLPRSRRRVGVNSFGYGGANAHCVLESAPEYANPTPIASELRSATHNGRSRVRSKFLLPFSAFTTASLDARVADLSVWSGLDDVSLPDLAATLGQRRTHFKQRGYIVAGKADLQERLTTADSSLRLGRGQIAPVDYGFVFTGQGAQWPQMGKELLDEFPIFAAAIAEMDSVLAALPHAPSWTIGGALREPAATSQVGEVTHSQPLCTAVQVGLVKLLASWNIKPKAVVGHSSGEMAAAFAAGHVTLAEAITAAYYRGYVVGSQRMNGAMMAAGLSAAKADEQIEAAGLKGKVVVACINSPESVTISGDEDAIQTLLARFQSQKLFARALRTAGNAYHSHHMKAVGNQYETLVTAAGKNLDLSSSMTSDAIMFSSVTGLAHEGPFDAAYWRSNLENPVRFVDALSQLATAGPCTAYTMIELGPHSALELPIKQTRTQLKLEEDALSYFSALSRGKDAVDTVLGLVGSLWLAGHEIAWHKVNDPGFGKAWTPRVITDLPSYRWAYDGILWSESRLSTEFRNRQYGRHELLGSKVPGGSESDINWRNLVRPDDLPWLADHKLDETVVMPGGAFLSMAMEAVSQATGKPLTPGTGIGMRNVHIITACTIPTTVGAETELFTNLRQSPITNVSTSEKWWDFKISTYRQGVPVTHATGTVALEEPAQAKAIEPRVQLSEDAFEPSAKRIWYQRFEKTGLNYGPLFQSLDEIWVPRSKADKVMLAKVKLEQKTAADGAFGASYAFHPITLDAMVQAGIVATAEGQTRQMKGFVPTKFAKAEFRVPQDAEQQAWQIEAAARTSGINSAVFDAVLSSPGQPPVAIMEQSRLQNYTASTSNQDGLDRHPMLRVVWKPDINGPELLREEDLTRYLDHFFAEAKSPVKDEGLVKLGAAISLLSHRNPRLSILELGATSDDYGKAVLEMLDAGEAYKRLGSYSTAAWDDNGLVTKQWDLTAAEPKDAQPLKEGAKFDLVLMTDRDFAGGNLTGTKLEFIQSILSPEGLILAVVNESPAASLPPTLDVTTSKLRDGSGAVFVASGNEHRPELAGTTGKGKPVIIVEHEDSALGAATQKAVAAAGVTAKRVLFSSVEDAATFKSATVISLLEARSPLLAGLTDDEMRRLKLLTDNVKNLLWVTSGDVLDGKVPEMGLAAGLSRALMLEQPSLRFMVYDVDSSSRNPSRTAHNLVQVLTTSQAAGSESEYVEKEGSVHVARFLPDTKLNGLFRLAQGTESVDTTLGEISGPIQLAVSHPGQFDSIHFREIEIPASLAEDEVRVSVKAVGLNAKDLYVLAGKVDTPGATCALEFAGVIEQVGSGVTDLVNGDRVVVMAPNHFRSTEIVPSWAATKLLDDEDFSTVSTAPLVFATALYALQNRASLQAGESVLIHSGAGGVGIAAIQVANAIGAEVFTTVSTEDKKNFLVEKLGVKAENIFTSRDASFTDDILKATDGRGVDVVLNSLTGDLLRASWRCVGQFGRFVEIGKRDLLDSGRLEMDQFLRNATFSAFDLSEIYLEGKAKNRAAFQRLWKKLLDQVVSLMRAGTIKPFSSFEANQVFDVSEIPSALRFFSSRNRIGKVAISMENATSPLRVQPLRYATRLSSDKSYIMIGCLGGLGRSLSRWMLGRGARKFVFVGRSGTDKPSARRIVEDLTAAGAECTVVRGDVVNYDDVKKAVDAVQGKIGGVVQAAMGLNEALFTTMPNKYWHTGIDPKVIGTWNIHNAIQSEGKDSELEFFLMTSSVSGSVGTATESNYCAGNHFLDMFARHRRSQGRPALAIGFGMISEIGYLHDNPEIEALLLRKGIQAINEDEFLQITDLAMARPMELPHVWDVSAANHVLTGLEPFGFMELRRKGFEVTNLTFNDPRALVLAGVLDSDADAALKQQDGSLPAEVAKAMDEEGATLVDAVQQHIKVRFGNLVLTPADKVPPQKPLAEFGMDSMIAAEFRTWFFQAFKFDVPFLELLSKTVTVSSLAKMVAEDIEARSA